MLYDSRNCLKRTGQTQRATLELGRIVAERFTLQLFLQSQARTNVTKIDVGFSIAQRNTTRLVEQVQMLRIHPNVRNALVMGENKSSGDPPPQI